MFTDMVGFTALTQSDEAQSLEVLERHNRLLRPFFPKFRGREVKAIGDSFLVEFASALDATNCAIDIQSFLHDYNVSTSNEWKITLRIGIHLGDVVHKNGDVFGDAVNIASRLQPLAEPEGVCVSEQVFDQVTNKVPHTLLKLEPRDLKGVRFAVDVYKVVMSWEPKGISSPIESDKRRVAVLPFRNMSPDPNDEYFAEGVTEEIISTVSGISGLSVISRTSVMGYKGTTKKVEEIGKELKVGSILEGSFRKAGNRIRITTQLIDVADDRHLWAQNYDRNLDDVFEVQSDVAKQVADALRVRILTPEMERIKKRPTESTKAYTLYLKGRQLWNQRSIESLKKGAKFFEQAIQEDPNFAPGYSGLADCILILRSNWKIELDSDPKRAGISLARALDLDPGLAEAHASKGLMLREEFKLQESEDEFRRAIELKPSYSFAHMWYAQSLSYLPKWDETLEQIERAVELDPLSPVINENYGWYFFKKDKDYGKALTIWKGVAELDPGYALAHVGMAFAYGRMREYDDMEGECESFVNMTKGTFPLIGIAGEIFAAYLRDDKQAVKRLLPDIEAHLQELPLTEYAVAGYYLYLGEYDNGFKWMELAYSKKDLGLLEMATDEFLDGVRADPRYLDFLKRLGLT